MSQFYLYKNLNSDTSESYPYLLSIQSNLFDDLNTRVVIPLSSYRSISRNFNQLTPVIELNNEKYILMTHLISSVSEKELSELVMDLNDLRTNFLSALDMLISGI